LQVLGLLLSHGTVSGRGPVESAQAAALRANDTRTRAKSRRIRRDIRTSDDRVGDLGTANAHQLGVGAALVLG